MSDKLLSRFLRYVQIDTQSDESSNTFPSTPGQLVLLKMLKQELSKMGAADVQMTKHGYVMASVPSNTRKARVPIVAFLAHVDTAPDCSGKNVKPILHRKANGALIETACCPLADQVNHLERLIRGQSVTLGSSTRQTASCLNRRFRRSCFCCRSQTGRSSKRVASRLRALSRHDRK